ncbi:MAG: hypothetical protein FJ222_11790 [Lentisphaerae bacterium]|nr:hypothetical protein [Lentisphaerota bacterium]
MRLRSNNQVITNMFAMYGQTAVCGFLMFFSNRWILSALGESDFGLFSVVGGVIAFLLFINGAMTSSAQRHLTFQVGGGDSEGLRRVFNAAMLTHLLLALLVLAVGETFGVWFVKYVLKMPEERRFAASLAFQCSLFSTSIMIVTVPFRAMFTAHQRMFELSALTVLQSGLLFTFAYCLKYLPGDRLVWYAAGYATATTTIYAIQSVRGRLLFPSCRICVREMKNWPLVRELLSFSLWNLFGHLGGVFRGQGMAIILNLGFGTKLNAAYGIANQVAGQVGQFASGFLQAVAPEIVSRQGAGETDRMISLGLRTCRFAALMGLLWMVPIAFELNYLLTLWLKKPPQYTTMLCLFVFAMSVADKLTVGYVACVQAVGKIAAYQVTLGLGMILTLPICYVITRGTESVQACFWGATVMAAVVSLGRVYWGRRLLGVSLLRWLREVLLPVAASMAPGMAACCALTWCLPSSFLRLLAVMAAGLTLGLVGIYGMGLHRDERAMVREKVIGRLLKRGRA